VTQRLFAIYKGVLSTIERNDETASTASSVAELESTTGEAFSGDTSQLIPHRLVVIAGESMVLDADNLMNIDDEELLDALLGDRSNKAKFVLGIHNIYFFSS